MLYVINALPPLLRCCSASFSPPHREETRETHSHYREAAEERVRWKKMEMERRDGEKGGGGV